MPIHIDEEQYRSLFHEALDIVKTMTPHLAQDALSKAKDPTQAIGDAIDHVFRRVLEGFEKQEGFTKDPSKRPASMRPKARVPFA